LRHSSLQENGSLFVGDSIVPIEEVGVGSHLGSNYPTITALLHFDEISQEGVFWHFDKNTKK